MLVIAAVVALTTPVDIPAGWAAIIVAALALIGVILTNRFSRVRALERENRELWLACKGLLHTLYKNGIEPEPELVELINGKE